MDRKYDVHGEKNKPVNTGEAMGKYFVMSVRFNKCSALDFGLIPKDSGTAIDPNDNSIWVKTELYDFGWGKENGFYKAPLPDFDTLLELVLHSEDRDDMYGAAAIILEKYADELLYRCEAMMNAPLRNKEFRRLAEVFRLEEPLTRCSVDQKTSEQIKSNHTRWKKIAQAAGKIR